MGRRGAHQRRSGMRLPLPLRFLFHVSYSSYLCPLCVNLMHSDA